MSDWAETFRTGLRCLAGGQLDLAERRLTEASALMRKEAPSDLWEAFLSNSLALAAARRGDYGAGQEHYRRSLQLWQDGGFHAADATTGKALEWFESTLKGAGLSQEAALLARRRLNAQLPLLDPFEEPPTEGSPALTASASEWLGDAAATLAAPKLAAAPAAPVRPAPAAPASWSTVLQEGLTLARQGRGPVAADRLENALDLARALQSTDRGLRTCLSYNALAMGLFLSGDYPGSDTAQAEAVARWDLAAQSPEQAPLDEYVAALRAADLVPESRLVAERRAAGQPPLLSPWQDLSSSGMARAGGPTSAAAFSPDTDWAPAVEEALSGLAQGRDLEAVQQLSRLVEKLRPVAPLQRVRLALSRGGVSLAAYLQGDYGLAETAYQEACQDWERVPPAERSGGAASEFVAALRAAGLDEVHALVEPRLGSALPPLLNPFEDKITTSRMAVLAGGTLDEGADLEPAAAYQHYLEEGLRLASQRKYEPAQRQLLQAVQKGGMPGGPPVRAALATDALAIVCQLAGDYAGAERAYHDARALYLRKNPVISTPSVRGAILGLADLLHKHGLTGEAAKLKELLDAGGSEPVLLCPWTDVAEPQLRKDLPAGKGETVLGPVRGRRQASRGKAGLLWGLAALLLVALAGGAAWWMRPQPAPKLPDHVVFGFLDLTLKAKKKAPKVDVLLEVKNIGTQPVKADPGFAVEVLAGPGPAVTRPARQGAPLTLAAGAKKVLVQTVEWGEGPARVTATYGSTRLGIDL